MRTKILYMWQSVMTCNENLTEQFTLFIKYDSIIYTMNAWSEKLGNIGRTFPKGIMRRFCCRIMKVHLFLRIEVCIRIGNYKSPRLEIHYSLVNSLFRKYQVLSLTHSFEWRTTILLCNAYRCIFSNEIQKEFRFTQCNR